MSKTESTTLSLKTHTLFGGHITVMESTDAGRHHLSISHKKRLPTWNEIKIARALFCKPNAFYVMVLPPEEYYVNLHQFCFQIWEVPEGEDVKIWKGM